MNKICTCHESEKTGQTSVMCCNKCGLPDEDFWQPPTSPEEVSAEKIWKELRDKYFKECTNFKKGVDELCKVDMNPHNLFEWFKKEFASHLKGKEDEITETQRKNWADMVIKKQGTIEKLQFELKQYKQFADAEKSWINQLGI